MALPRFTRPVAWALGITFAAAAVTLAQDGNPPVPRDGKWIDDDIETALAAALETGKPLLVAFR